MDGKHITFQAPINSGLEYYNYKNFFITVLFALVDANYNFLYVDIGCLEKDSDILYSDIYQLDNHRKLKTQK